MTTTIPCKVCSCTCEELGSNGDYANYYCTVCGRYQINGSLDEKWDTVVVEGLKGKLCRYINLRQSCDKPVMLNFSISKTLEKEPIVSPAEVLDELMLKIYTNHHTLQTSSQPLQEFFPIIADFNNNTVYNYFNELQRQGLIQSLSPKPMASSEAGKHRSPQWFTFSLTLAGFKKYEQLKKKRESNLVFVALQYASSFDSFFFPDCQQTIETETGYQVRDLRKLNKAGNINAQLEAAIRSAKLFIADVTPVKLFAKEGQTPLDVYTNDDRETPLKLRNPNVFWEAGFAEGLGIPVIYTCEGPITGMPFDTRNHYHIAWQSHKPDEFVNDLIAAIKNTFNTEFF